LICDLLKGNNEQLRELAIELKVRREEEHKRFQMMTPRMVAAPAVEKAEKAATVALPQAEEKRPQRAGRSLAAPGDAKDKRRLAPEALAAMQRGAELAASPRPRHSERAVEPAVEIPVETVTERVAPRVAAKVAEPVLERVVAQAAVSEPALLERPAVLERTVAEPVRAQAKPVQTAPPVAEPVTIIESAFEPAAVQAAPVAAKSVRSAAAGHSPVRMNVRPPADVAASGSRDWGSLLQARRSEKPGLLDAVMAETTSTASAQAAEPVLPAGLQDGYVLTRLVESRQPVSGLVVSIGVNAPADEDGSLPSNVRTLIQSLIGPSDFAAQSAAEEFLLIYPGERGAAAQRRLTQIAQQLWDFQLCAMGTASILFSWGGVEVRSESIDEAIASATERMQETRRGRKVHSMNDRQLAKAV
jgi:hypothetical protein